MKHRFLLDENILHHAIKGVDKHDNEDFSAAYLVLFIASNCHTIVLNDFLQRRYNVHLKQLATVKSGILQPIFVLKQMVFNASKVARENDVPPDLPANCQIPAEDVDVVKAALISHPIIVTADDDLRLAVNACEALHLRAMDPVAALELAHDT